MKILIIGGDGNIGYPISKKLHVNNEITILCKDKPKFDDAIKYINGDGYNKPFLEEIQEKNNFDIVINLIIFTPEQAEVNVEVFKNKIKQFVFISTATIFNHEKSVIITEETEKGNIHSWYAQAKLKCENVFLSAKETSNFPITIVRPSQTYSKDKIPLSVKGKSCWSVISRIKRDLPVIIHGDGTSAWVSTHSDDFSTGFVKLIGNEKCYGEDFDITSNEIYNWNIIYEFLGEALNKKVKTIHIPTDILTLSKKYDYKMSIEGDKQYSVIFNNKKLKEVAPDFKCNISIKEGILKYLDYMENNPNLQKEEPDFDEWCEKIIEKYNEFKNSIAEII